MREHWERCEHQVKMLLSRGKAVVIVKQQKTWLCACAGWRAELVNKEHGHFAKEILIKVLKVQPGFSLLLIVKCERREKMRNELVNKTTTTTTNLELEDLENSQLVHIAKDEERVFWRQYQTCCSQSTRWLGGQQAHVILGSRVRTPSHNDYSQTLKSSVTSSIGIALAGTCRPFIPSLLPITSLFSESRYSAQGAILSQDGPSLESHHP